MLKTFPINYQEVNYVIMCYKLIEEELNRYISKHYALHKNLINDNGKHDSIQYTWKTNTFKKGNDGSKHHFHITFS